MIAGTRLRVPAHRGGPDDYDGLSLTDRVNGNPPPDVEPEEPPGTSTMHHRPRHLFLSLLMLLWGLWAWGMAFAQVQDGTRFLEHGGQQRWYHYHLPAGYLPETLHPVILNFHGGGGDASRVADSTDFNTTSDAHGFIAVYPQGVGDEFLGPFFGVWNGGNCCGIAADEDVDDTGFIELVLDDLENSFSVDATRVYATGISNGAMMSYRVACELDHRIAAVAPIAGMDQGLECEPQRPVPILHIHGTADQCSLYDSRLPEDPGFCEVDGKVQLSGGCFQMVLSELLGIPVEPICFYQPPVPTHVKTWWKRNGCPRAQPPVFERNGAAVCMTWGPCEAGTEVTLCAIKGGGHTWPGAPPSGPCVTDPDGPTCMLFNEILGVTSQDLDANELMWSFFQRHRLPD